MKCQYLCAGTYAHIFLQYDNRYETKKSSKKEGGHIRKGRRNNWKNIKHIEEPIKKCIFETPSQEWLQYVESHNVESQYVEEQNVDHKMSNSHNVELTKCRIHIMLNAQNVEFTKCRIFIKCWIFTNYDKVLWVNIMWFDIYKMSNFCLMSMKTHPQMFTILLRFSYVYVWNRSNIKANQKVGFSSMSLSLFIKIMHTYNC